MHGVRDIELGRQRRIKLVDVPPIAHDALALGDVEVARHLVDQHAAADHAALVFAEVGEVLCAVVDALRGVAQDLVDAPLLALVGLDQLVARVAASERHAAEKVIIIMAFVRMYP